MPYRQVWTSLWTEDWFAGLPAHAKLLYLYLLTADNTRPTGVLERSARRVALDLGLPTEDIKPAIAALNGRVRYWDNLETWWVIRYPLWQGRGAKWEVCIRQAALGLPPSIRQAFYATYPQWRNTPSDTPSDTLFHTPSEGVSQSAISNFSHQQTTDNRQQSSLNNQQTSPPSPPMGGDTLKFLEVVLLSREEHGKLEEKFGAAGAAERIEALALYIKSKGAKYKSHYFTILNWERMPRKKEAHYEPDPVKRYSKNRVPDHYTRPEDL